jgi:CelD/BcsL family acetyltransferase involved in cellulose biosynthesis
VKVQAHDSFDAVGASAWDGLVAATCLRSPFLSWTWQHEWALAFAVDRRLEIRVVQDDGGHLVALLPLYEDSPGVMRMIGGADVSDYLDLIAVEGREEEAWSALLQSRGTDRVEWRLHAVPGGSATVAALPQIAASSGLAATATVEERCPVLALPRSWDTYLASLSGKHRHELQRKIRRLEREAPEARVRSSDDPASIEASLNQFLVLHRRSRVGKARFMDGRMEGFFRRVLGALAARGGARVWLLETAAGPIASFITLEWDGTVGLYNSGFDPQRAPLSPGVVLLAHLVRDAIERSKRTFDFLRGEERYKFEFGPIPEPVYAVTIV